MDNSFFTHSCLHWYSRKEEIHCSTSHLGKGSSAVMKNNNTMAVVLSFVLCSYAYQDAGRAIKAWISCHGWISSPAFWQSKFILVRRNVDLHYAIMILLAQEDQTFLSKLPSCLITIWFQYPIFKVWVHRSETTRCSLKCCRLSLSLHTGVWVLKGLFISRITWHFSIWWECQRMDRSLRAAIPSIRLQDSSTQLRAALLSS